MANILMIGCGDIGTPLGFSLSAEGHHVWGLRRSKTLPEPIQTITADVCQPITLTALSDIAFDYVVVTLTPGGFTDQAYQSAYVQGLTNVLAAIDDLQRVKRLFFISSTSVYDQSDGQWVNEGSATEPKSFSGKRLLEAERLLAESGVKYTVVRFAGIYGPGRNRLIEQVRSLQGCVEQPSLYTNRIHRDDCVGFLAHLISMDQQGLVLQNCYLGVDSEPVPMFTVKAWLAEQLGINPALLTAHTNNRRSSKRCSNKRMLATGYQLKYSGFQQGYATLLGKD
jgi:nucleoside-diphosphate-sugar epimerase